MAANAGQSHQGQLAQPMRIAAPALGYTGLGSMVNMAANAGQSYQDNLPNL
jgi:hypothetical protein